MQPPSDSSSLSNGGLRGPGTIRANVAPKTSLLGSFPRTELPNSPVTLGPRPNNPWPNPPPPANNWPYVYPAARPPLLDFIIPPPPPPIPELNFEPVASSQWNESQWPPAPSTVPWPNSSSYYRPPWNAAPSQALPLRSDRGRPIAIPKAQLSSTNDLGHKDSGKLPNMERHSRDRKRDHQHLSKIGRSSSRESLRSRRRSRSRDRSRRRSSSRSKRPKRHRSRESRASRSRDSTSISRSPSRSRSRSPSCSKERSSSRMSSRKRRSPSRERGRIHHLGERSSTEKLRSVIHVVEPDNGSNGKPKKQKKWTVATLTLNSRSKSVTTDPEPEIVVDLDKELEEETTIWTRCSPADLFYQRSRTNPAVMVGTPKLVTLLDRFKSELVDRAENVRSSKPKYEPPARKLKMNLPEVNGSDEESNGEETDEDSALKELEHKRNHPDRLHKELWYNEAGEMNDGPLCKCSVRASSSGIRHGIYSGEEHLEPCDPNSNNADRLHHYRITMSPHTNFLTKVPTVIRHDGHEFIFEGFSMFSHYPLVKLPTCKVLRFNIDYAVHYIEEKFPDNFTIRGIELFCDYLLRELLELLDLDFRAYNDPTGCKRFHFYPRFARALDDNGKEILSMNEVISYLLSSSKPLVEEADIVPVFMKMNQFEWQNFADEVKGMIVTYPGKKPCSLRVDQLDRDMTNVEIATYPDIVHFGIRPLQLSYAGNPYYQKAWREYVKFRHLLANKPKVSYQDRHKLMQKELRLQEMRTKCTLKRDITVVVSSKGFYRTGIMCDIVQHAMLLPVLVCHLRFHKSLNSLEEHLGHEFQDRYLLQLALTHPSYRENFGTNPDHARNSLTNCGIRQPEYGDRRIHYIHTRKRGITTLINIMSRFGKPEVSMSNISHNERLEFLGDAVVEFLTSIHLFHLFPEIEEGGLATYRAAIVQNQHLAVLAKRLQLDKFMLYAHGSDLCHDLELRHAMANCFEALMGALFLDSGVDIVDRIFSETLFHSSMENFKELLDTWVNYPRHPIQEQEPDGDRQWIESVPLLKKLTKFEEEIGVEFKHIRLLARAFTHRSVGYNNLTLGSNQRLEFLGDTVLQLVASEHLFKFFPEHHEGHLSLLRSSLVNNRTQSVVCNDLGMVDYAIYAYPKDVLRAKDRADLLEAVLGALYVDKGVDYCRVFCQVCFFPRLQDFIMNQDWNDPKSKLQQCCLTLRTMDGGEPDIPMYKVIECKGPTNTRTFTVAVYFRGERLAQGRGHSIQQAEMQAAKLALASSKAELFPQLQYQKRVIERSIQLRQQQQAME